jgi:hypothetical protein
LNEYWTIPATVNYAPGPIFYACRNVTSIKFYITKDSLDNPSNDYGNFLQNYNNEITIHVPVDSGLTEGDFYKLVGGTNYW